MTDRADQSFSFRDIEGTYRRGYHQAVAAVAFALEHKLVTTAAELEAWVEGPGMRWRKDVTLEAQVEAPELFKPE